MSWHYEPTTGIHTRHPLPNRPLPFRPYEVLDLSEQQVRQMAATHEAGHVVGLFAAGIGFDEIIIADRDAGDSGVHGIQIPETGPTPPTVAMTIATGERASDRWLHEQGLWTPDRAWANEILARGDRGKLADWFPGHDIEALHDEADQLLGQLWPAVLRLVEALDRRGQLTYEQAREHAAILCGR